MAGVGLFKPKRAKQSKTLPGRWLMSIVMTISGQSLTSGPVEKLRPLGATMQVARSTIELQFSR